MLRGSREAVEVSTTDLEIARFTLAAKKLGYVVDARSGEINILSAVSCGGIDLQLYPGKELKIQRGTMDQIQYRLAMIAKIREEMENAHRLPAGWKEVGESYQCTCTSKPVYLSQDLDEDDRDVIRQFLEWMDALELGRV